MATPQLLKSFAIIGLYGEKDVTIDFQSDTTIFIADNGVGKTTILGMLYAVLSGNLQRLRRYQFDHIEVKFDDDLPIEIASSAVQPALDLSAADPDIRRILRRVPEELVYRLFDETRTFDIGSFIRYPLARSLAEAAGVPPSFLYGIIHERTREHRGLFESTLSLEDIRKRIQSSFPLDVLYFPTYRRIEEDLEYLGYEKKEGNRSEALIQFGMGDVATRLRSVTDSIRKASVASYAKINGQMLSQLVDGIKNDENTYQSIQNQDALTIVLDRVGASITPQHKRDIVQMVVSRQIETPQYEYLAYFLSNLITIYDQQKDLDNSIKAFAAVCNRYLVDKEVVYNESTLEIDVLQKDNLKQVKLAQLSSGEKQIVSLFSRLYLETGRSLALLFDEPELSLSIEWQKTLLPDIMQSERCLFLIATTHSPFIFENIFDSKAFDLKQFIRRIAK